MALLQQWEAIIEQNAQTPESYKKFHKEYIETEKYIYIQILDSKTTNLKGSIKDLSDKYEVLPILFVAFLDGVNTSLTEELKLDDLTEESVIDITIDFKKLFYNMLDAKADWLHKLPQWDDILSTEERKQIKHEFMLSKTVIKEAKVGRNDPCPCGSGKKYKKCCLK